MSETKHYPNKPGRWIHRDGGEMRVYSLARHITGFLYYIDANGKLRYPPQGGVWEFYPAGTETADDVENV